MILIGVDRDGTLIEDDGSFPGSKWPEEEFVLKPGVVDGLRLLQGSLYAPKIVMVTNQSGPARGKVKAEHILPVNEAINGMLRQHGLGLDAVLHCEHVPATYRDDCVAKGKQIDNNYVCECCDWKPGIGMLEKAAVMFGTTLDKCMVYVVGDRPADVQTGLNAGGKGVFVQSGVEHSIIEDARRLQNAYPARVHIANDFLTAAEWIVRDALGK